MVRKDRPNVSEAAWLAPSTDPLYVPKGGDAQVWVVSRSGYSYCFVFPLAAGAGAAANVELSVDGDSAHTLVDDPFAWVALELERRARKAQREHIRDHARAGEAQVGRKLGHGHPRREIVRLPTRSHRIHRVGTGGVVRRMRGQTEERRIIGRRQSHLSRARERRGGGHELYKKGDATSGRGSPSSPPAEEDSDALADTSAAFTPETVAKRFVLKCCRARGDRRGDRSESPSP